MKKKRLDEKSNEITEVLKKRMQSHERMTVVMAPPGSGKTHLLVEVLAASSLEKRRIAVATPTNAQADEVCERLHKKFPHVPLLRFLSSTALPKSTSYRTTQKKDDVTSLTHGVVVGSVAKWSFLDLRNDQPFDYLVLEEAWQVKLSDFLTLLPLSERFIMIGDPGQIDPVVSIDAARWATTVIGPHRAAPEAIMDADVTGLVKLQLPASRRLPMDSVGLVQNFYNFPFESYADPNDRALTFQKRIKDHRFSKIWEATEGSSIVGITKDIIKSEAHPPLEGDREMARLTTETIVNLLELSPTIQLNPGEKLSLTPQDIGIASTRRAIVQDLSMSLPADLRQHIRVDTPERWQGLERPVMFVVHPLSSVVKPSAFDLQTGRLCVMASRHKVQLFVVSRPHVPDALAEYDPPGDQALGAEDDTGKGHDAHLRFIRELQKRGVWVKAA